MSIYKESFWKDHQTAFFEYYNNILAKMYEPTGA
jgi:hypothetical protein